MWAKSGLGGRKNGAHRVPARYAPFGLAVPPGEAALTWTQQQKGLFLATFGAGTPGHFGAFMFGEA
eukprot:gene25088-32189_t